MSILEDRVKPKIGFGITITIIAIIFLFSSQSNGDSHIQSDGLLTRSGIVERSDIENRTEKYLFWDRKIRKTAHLILYLSLGSGVYLLTGRVKISVGVVFVLAGIDEFYQAFIPGRTGQFIDVILDTCGGITGITTLNMLLKEKEIRC